VSRGAVLLTAYSMGLGIPFLLAAAGIGNVSQLLRRYGKYLRYISIATGIFLIVIGVMLFTNSLAVFARYAPFTQFQTNLDQGIINFWQWLTGGRG
jgi:cytochrome c-type biogenesis protein